MSESLHQLVRHPKSKYRGILDITLIDFLIKIDFIMHRNCSQTVRELYHEINAELFTVRHVLQNSSVSRSLFSVQKILIDKPHLNHNPCGMGLFFVQFHFWIVRYIFKYGLLYGFISLYRISREGYIYII